MNNCATLEYDKNNEVVTIKNMNVFRDDHDGSLVRIKNIRTIEGFADFNNQLHREVTSRLHNDYSIRQFGISNIYHNLRDVKWWVHIQFEEKVIGSTRDIDLILYTENGDNIVNCGYIATYSKMLGTKIFRGKYAPDYLQGVIDALLVM